MKHATGTLLDEQMTTPTTIASVEQELNLAYSTYEALEAETGARKLAFRAAVDLVRQRRVDHALGRCSAADVQQAVEAQAAMESSDRTWHDTMDGLVERQETLHHQRDVMWAQKARAAHDAATADAMRDAEELQRMGLAFGAKCQEWAMKIGQLNPSGHGVRPDKQVVESVADILLSTVPGTIHHTELRHCILDVHHRNTFLTWTQYAAVRGSRDLV